VAVLRLDVVDQAVPDLDGACGRLLEPGDDAKCCRLPAAGRPEQDEELLVGHLEGEIVDRGDVAEALRDPTDGDPAHDLLVCFPLLVGRENRPASGEVASSPANWHPTAAEHPVSEPFDHCSRSTTAARGYPVENEVPGGRGKSGGTEEHE